MKNLLIGFTGSVASILSGKLCKAFMNEYNVKAVVTEAARQFVDPEELYAMHVDVFSDKDEFYPQIALSDPPSFSSHQRTYQKNDPVRHIVLRDWADCLLIAPCSANTLAKIANGICDNLLTSIARAWDFSLHKELPCNSRKKIILAPAMNTKMWSHPITTEHIEKISQWGIWVVKPITKQLACGETGEGAMAEIETIAHTVKQAFYKEVKVVETSHKPTSDGVIRCEVIMPHVRNINGQTLMFEPMFSGIVTVPNDDDTKRAIDAGYLKVVST